MADGADLPFDREEFDVVLLHRVLCHVPSPDQVLAESFRVVRAGGALTVFEGDYATITLATGADGPFNSCVSAFRSSYINDPWLVRRLPALVRAAGFRPGPLRSHGVIQTDDPNYLLSVADRGADALARSGRIGGELAEALRAEARRRVRTHEFFGYIGYASLIAVKAH